MILDLGFFSKIAQINETSVFKGGKFFQLTDIEAEPYTGFDDGRVGQEVAQWLSQAQMFELKDKNIFFGG